MNNQQATNLNKTEFARRCTSAGQVFAGGGSQISAIKQDSAGQIYVIGDIRKNNAGTLNFRHVEVRGPHCKVGVPDITYASASTCTAAGGGWVDSGYCSLGNYTTSTACFVPAARGAARIRTIRGDHLYMRILQPAKWREGVGGIEITPCRSSRLQARRPMCSSFASAGLIARPHPPPAVASGDSGVCWSCFWSSIHTRTLSLLSQTTEQAINVWLINNVAYYSSFDTGAGTYKLNRVTARPARQCWRQTLRCIT